MTYVGVLILFSQMETLALLSFAVVHTLSIGSWALTIKLPTLFAGVQHERALKVIGNTNKVHVEDLEELRQATPRVVWNRGSMTHRHRVVVNVVFDHPLVERKA